MPSKFRFNAHPCRKRERFPQEPPTFTSDPRLCARLKLEVNSKDSAKLFCSPASVRPGSEYPPRAACRLTRRVRIVQRQGVWRVLRIGRPGSRRDWDW